jgi:hypothetical protein
LGAAEVAPELTAEDIATAGAITGVVLDGSATVVAGMGFGIAPYVTGGAGVGVGTGAGTAVAGRGIGGGWTMVRTPCTGGGWCLARISTAILVFLGCKASMSRSAASRVRF